MSRCNVLGELDIIDNAINDLRLRKFDPTIVLIPNIDAKVILNLPLVLNV